ncbi:histidine phosphatase family protein [Actinotalea sp. BY-33]|uniref:Histidine phosphatase family protein n=1 Tax=Actinotalea soli TaxID=2819234 RepID=A0A939LUX3_9CELL|nr:histidine phosphatase family protein [Actinotalea soli]MBO1751742.1 histidine phosphatase family protein [Actinotalea soli]
MPPADPALSPTPLTLHLVRHGRTVYNTEGRLQGWCDSPLTEEGLDGVRVTADHLSATPFTAAYASPSGRTVATARELLRHHPDTSLTTLDGLREFSFGDYEATPEVELWARIDPHEMFTGVLMGTFEGLPGGESSSDYLARVSAAFEEIAAAHSAGDHVLVVGHGVTLMAYLVMVHGAAVAPLANASISTVEIDADGGRRVVRTGHEPAAQLRF